MQEFNLADLEAVDIQFEEKDNKKTVNFGGGVELLMNDKKRRNMSNINNDLGELDQLEQELNQLSGNSPVQENETKTLSGFASNLFSFSEPDEDVSRQSDSKLGSATANSVSGVSRSFDGFSKINEIPNDYSNRQSDKDKRIKKRKMMKQLDEWNRNGFNSHPTINHESSYEEVEEEFESTMEDKRKKDSIKVQGHWFMTFINTIEYANAVFDPFDMNLSGWGEQVSEDLESYEDIFAELFYKYKSGKLSPEISLLLRLGFSAAMVAFSNRSFSTATPGYDDVVKQSPELMKEFTKKATQMMSDNLMNRAQGNLNDTNMSFGPPPAPIETKLPPPSQRQNVNNMMFTQRPDIAAARAGSQMFREQGIDINKNQENLFVQETTPLQRKEMKGPQKVEIDNLLSGLKTRDIPLPPRNINIMEENDSMISATSMKDMLGQTRPTKRSNKRRSSGNTLSLDVSQSL